MDKTQPDRQRRYRARLQEARNEVPALKTRIAELEAKAEKSDGNVEVLVVENAELKEKLAAAPATPPASASHEAEAERLKARIAELEHELEAKRLGPLADAEKRAFREWCAERGETPGNDALRKFIRESLDAYAARKSSAATPAPTVASPAAVKPASAATPAPTVASPAAATPASAPAPDTVEIDLSDIPEEQWSVGGYVDRRKKAQSDEELRKFEKEMQLLSDAPDIDKSPETDNELQLDELNLDQKDSLQ